MEAAATAFLHARRILFVGEQFVMTTPKLRVDITEPTAESTPAIHGLVVSPTSFADRCSPVAREEVECARFQERIESMVIACMHGVDGCGRDFIHNKDGGEFRWDSPPYQ